MKKLIPVILAACSVIAMAADNWPQFRGPDGTGHSDAKDLPTEWSETKNIVWKTEIHDRGWSSPVIFGKQVWLTSASKDGRQLFAICLDRDTGKVIRDIKLFDVTQPQYAHPFNTYASPTPVIEQGRVYITF
nr:quinonprotein alcohol dehydrogenase [Acidobacteriota bacterium]